MFGFSYFRILLREYVLQFRTTWQLCISIAPFTQVGVAAAHTRVECAFVIWTTWPLTGVWGGGAKLDIAFTSANNPRSLHWHVSLCIFDWQATMLPHSQGLIQDFHGGGGGGGRRNRLCARTHIMSMKPEVPYDQVFFMLYHAVFEPYFEAFW